MKKKILIRTALLASLGLFIATSAIAGPHHGRGYRNWGNSAAFTEACSGKAAGDTVQLTTPRGRTLDAVCETDGGGVLYARPTAPRGAEQYYNTTLAACQDKKPGDKVQVKTPCGVTIEGTCIQQGQDLRANIGNQFPCGYGAQFGRQGHWGRGPGNGPQYGGGYGAIDSACQGKNKGEKVSFETRYGDIVDIICGDTTSNK